MSKLGILWFTLSGLIVIYDAGFILLRPRTLQGGDLHYLWKLYKVYYETDLAYADMKDTFVIAQSWLNLVEVCFSFATVYLLLKKSKQVLLVGFFVSSLTFWKTVIYMIQYTGLCNGSHRVAHMTWNQLIFIFVIPNGVWLLFSSFFILSYGNQLRLILASQKEKKKN